MEAELLKKTQDLENLQRSFDEYVDSSKELEVELEKALADADNKLKESETKRSAVEQKYKTAKENLERANKTSQDAQNECEKLREKLTSVEELKRKLENDNEDLNNQVRILQASEEDLRNKLVNAEEEVIFFKTDLEEMKTQRRELEVGLLDEIGSLKSQLASHQFVRTDSALKREIVEEASKFQLDRKVSMEEINKFEDNAAKVESLVLMVEQLTARAAELEAINKDLAENMSKVQERMITSSNDAPLQQAGPVLTIQPNQQVVELSATSSKPFKMSPTSAAALIDAQTSDHKRLQQVVASGNLDEIKSELDLMVRPRTTHCNQRLAPTNYTLTTLTALFKGHKIR